jgi:CRISPR/Cas system CSM-associated protein Csm3 (group 7 of RAMP superfamily)
MNNERLQRHQRKIIERIIIRGTLILDTSTCLGNGDADGPTDMMLLRDSISPGALLTGASIAGALRNYLHEYEKGYGQETDKNSLATELFGSIRQDKDGDQSPLIINNAISSDIPRVELRDGVEIDGKTGTAKKGAKYDLEVLATGTEFPLDFELLIEEGRDRNRLLEALSIVLRGLEEGEIGIGMKKSRGLGRCSVKGWRVWQFNLKEPKDLRAWLMFDRERTEPPEELSTNIKLFPSSTSSDQRCRFQIKATFRLLGSLIIRSGQAETGTVPDAVHLKSGDKPVVSGTSLTGVLRHRADRIVKTLGASDTSTFVDELFGKVEEKTKKVSASRLIVHETVIKNVNELVQTRIAIDRFTGGAYHGALFEEQPVFAQDTTEVTLRLELRNPEDAEIGLLLLLLKDLWTGDLPVGGESAIGRGRLQGVKAEIEKHKVWTIEQQGDRLEISDASALEAFVKKLHEVVHE